METVNIHADSDHEIEVNETVTQLEVEAGVTEVVPPPTMGATIQDYRRAYTEAEQNVLKMRVLLRQVQMRCAELEAQISSTRRSRKSIPKEVGLHGTEITALGRKFAVFVAPWLDTKIEVITRRPSIDYHSEQRYVSNEANQQAARAELFDHVPAPLHKLMGFNAFADTYRSAMQSQRSNVVYNARSVAHVVFPTVPVNLLNLNAGGNRLENDEIRRLLGYSGNRKYHILPPLLYPPGEESQQSQLFRSPALLKIGRAILFGPTSVDTPSASFRPHPNSTGKKWGVIEISPGFIALVGITAIYILSPDTNFHEKGGESGIQYHVLFNRYKQLVISSLRLPRGRSLLKLWNDYVFGTANSTGDSTNNSQDPGNNDDDDEAFNTALQALQNDAADDNNANHMVNTGLDVDYGDVVEDDIDHLTNDVDRMTTTSAHPSASLATPAMSLTSHNAGPSTTDHVDQVPTPQATSTRRRTRPPTTRPPTTRPPTRTAATRSQCSENGRGNAGRRRAIA